MYFRENTSKYLLWINHKIGHFLIRKVLRDIADWVVRTTMDYTEWLFRKNMYVK